MANQIPPAYSTTDNTTVGPGPPPTYTAPTQFTIGSKLTPEPLVNISQIKAHLALLHAFAEFKKEVEGLKEGTIPQMPADLERRWAWFVSLAVQRSVLICCDPGYFHIHIFLLYRRFDVWCHALILRDAEKSWEEILPPIDVLMVCDLQNRNKKYVLIMFNKVWHAYMLNPMYVRRSQVIKTDC